MAEASKAQAVPQAFEAPGPPAAPEATEPGTALADAVRRLITVVVTADAPGAALRRAAMAVQEVADELVDHVPVPPRPHLYHDAPTLAESMPYDLVVGPRNPLAVPLVVRAVGRPHDDASSHDATEGPGDEGPFVPTVEAEGTFTLAYQGAPGWVHGGAIAAAFDIVLAAANQVAGAAGPTVDLQVRYRRPTAVDVPVLMQATVSRRTERRVVSRARLVQGAVTTATATGTFALVVPTAILGVPPVGPA